MIADVGGVHAAVRPDGQVVRRSEVSLAPVVNDVAVLIENDHGMVAPVIDEDAVLRVNSDADSVIPFPAFRKFAPAGHMLVGIVAISDPEALAILSHSQTLLD